MKVKTLKPKLSKFVTTHSISTKLSKQIQVLEENPKHPSLNTEKLQPKELGLYSFRIDRKYRAIFHILSTGEIEIVDINDHYQ